MSPPAQQEVDNIYKCTLKPLQSNGDKGQTPPTSDSGNKQAQTTVVSGWLDSVFGRFELAALPGCHT
jgi:hypothetical protein